MDRGLVIHVLIACYVQVACSLTLFGLKLQIATGLSRTEVKKDDDEVCRLNAGYNA